MRKIFLLLLLFTLINLVSIATAGTVIITGTLNSPSGNLFNGSIKFQLPFAGAVDTNCPGNCLVVPTVHTVKIVSGVVPSTTLLTRNGDISPSGTYYRAFIYSSYG